MSVVRLRCDSRGFSLDGHGAPEFGDVDAPCSGIALEHIGHLFMLRKRLMIVNESVSRF